MMKNMIYINSCLLSVILFAVCLVAAQEQLPTEASVTAEPVCNVTTTKPAPKADKFAYQTCIVAQLAAFVSLTSGQYVEFNNGKLNANLSRCENGTLNPKLVVDFECGQLEFEIGHSNNSVFVMAINGYYRNGTNPMHTFSNSTPMFKTTQSGHYYKCNTEQTVKLNDTNANLVISSFAYEAYRTATGTDFYQIVEECALDSGPVSDWVRIGVGICLVALVAIVLIAYFIGRRRWSERSSYESV